MNRQVTATSIEELRRQHYNTSVSEVRHVHDELLILRVKPDAGPLQFEPGQYVPLGLGAWERRADGIVAQVDDTRMVRRAYSISCPMLLDGKLVTTSQIDFIEFCVTLVSKPTDEPPPLTPRLFELTPGDRLHLGPHAHGHYTLAYVQTQSDVVFLGTGTGEAPHNAMTAELLSRGHQGRIFCCTCTRYRRDLPYLDVHRELESRYNNYRYFPLTTREPANLDPAHPDYTGRHHLQDFVGSGRFEREAGCTLDPKNTHIYVCGNPAMIGLPHKAPDGHLIYPEPPGMVEVLTHRGYQLDGPHNVGNIHFEKYW